MKQFLTAVRQKLAKHDVYDATSRSVQIDLPESLTGEHRTLSGDNRKPFGTPDMRAFVLDNFLTEEECNTLVDNSEKAGTPFANPL